MMKKIKWHEIVLLLIIITIVLLNIIYDTPFSRTVSGVMIIVLITVGFIRRAISRNKNIKL